MNANDLSLSEYSKLPNRLFGIASRFADRAEKADKGTQWPTVGYCAKSLGVLVENIEDIVRDYQGDGYMGLGIGGQVGGLGGGVWYSKPSEFVVEAYL
jgi:hypothetical protein